MYDNLGGAEVTMDIRRQSTVFAVVQIAMLVAFGGIYFLDSSPRLVSWGALDLIGSLLCLWGLVLMAIALVALRNVVRIAPEPRAGGGTWSPPGSTAPFAIRFTPAWCS